MALMKTKDCGAEGKFKGRILPEMKIAKQAGRDRSTISLSIFVSRTDGGSVDGWKANGADRCIFWLPAQEDRDAVLSRLDRWSQLL